MSDMIERGLADLGDFIRQQREVARMSVRRLADVADVSNPYLSQIERGLRRPSAEILQQIAKALRISVETLYVRAGILDPEHATENSVPEAISRDGLLTPEQKASLLTVYQSFIASNGVEEAVPPAAARTTPADRPTAEPAPAKKAPAKKAPAKKAPAKKAPAKRSEGSGN